MRPGAAAVLPRISLGPAQGGSRSGFPCQRKGPVFISQEGKGLRGFLGDFLLPKALGWSRVMPPAHPARAGPGGSACGAKSPPSTHGTHTPALKQPCRGEVPVPGLAPGGCLHS